MLAKLQPTLYGKVLMTNTETAIPISCNYLLLIENIPLNNNFNLITKPKKNANAEYSNSFGLCNFVINISILSYYNFPIYVI